MSGDVFNSNQPIPEILKKKQNMDKYPVNFFCMREIEKKNYFVQNECRKFHHI